MKKKHHHISVVESYNIFSASLPKIESIPEKLVKVMEQFAEGRRRNERKAAKETDRTEENTKKLGRE